MSDSEENAFTSLIIHNTNYLLWLRKIVFQWLKFVIRTREVQGSNLVQEPAYLSENFYVFLSPFRQMP
jgi:hypothetical protein